MITAKRVAAATLVIGLLALPLAASAASPTTVYLGLAAPFAILASETVTNTGPTVVTGDLGLHPGTEVTNFPPGILNGTLHIADTEALDGKNALITAYDDAARRTPETATNYDTVGGLVLVPGVYKATSTMGLTGTLTLDAEGDPNAVWIFQVGSALTTASDSTVAFLNGVGQSCNVFWQVTSSATIGTNTTFVGTILALTSIWVATGASIDGRALARNGEVTLDANEITKTDCAAVVPPPSPSPSASVAPSASPSASVAPSASPSPSVAPSASPSPTVAPSLVPTDSPAPIVNAPVLSSAPEASAAPVAVAAAAVPALVPAAVPAEALENTPIVDAPPNVIPQPTPEITLPPTDTDPLGTGSGNSSTFGGLLVVLGGLLVLAAATIWRSQPARR